MQDLSGFNCGLAHLFCKYLADQSFSRNSPPPSFLCFFRWPPLFAALYFSTLLPLHQLGVPYTYFPSFSSACSLVPIFLSSFLCTCPSSPSSPCLFFPQLNHPFLLLSLFFRLQCYSPPLLSKPLPDALPTPGPLVAANSSLQAYPSPLLLWQPPPHLYIPFTSETIIFSSDSTTRSAGLYNVGDRLLLVLTVS